MSKKAAKEFFESMLFAYIAELQELETYEEEWTNYEIGKYNFIIDEISELKKFISKEFE